MAMTMHIDIVSAEAEIFSGTVELWWHPRSWVRSGFIPAIPKC